MLALACITIRLLSALGGGDAFDGFIQAIGENGAIAKSVLSHELKSLPVSVTNDEPPEPGPERSDDAAGLYMQRTGDSEGPVPSATAPAVSAALPETPLVTSVIAENVEVPSPKPKGEDEADYSMGIINYTSYEIDVESYLSERPEIYLNPDAPQILIVHTHGSEAYSETEGSRTLDKTMNVVGVGDALVSELTEMGFNVLHDREIYDYPSYSGSYGRSLEAVESYLEQYPDIGIVIDLHRDSVTMSDGTRYRSEYENDGLSASQVMIIVSTGEAGLYHPNWQENMKFGIWLQKSMDEMYPGFARSLCVSAERYNQHAAPGYIILEVGTDGNSLEEALRAVKMFAAAAEPVIQDLF